MDKKPMNELADEIAKFKELIEVGATYTHYKGPTYTVKGFVVTEDNSAIGVLYQANYGPRLNFVRPATEWLEEVDGVQRFKKA